MDWCPALTITGILRLLMGASHEKGHMTGPWSLVLENYPNRNKTQLKTLLVTF